MALSDFFGSLGGGIRRGSEFLSGLMQPQKPTFEDNFNLPGARSFELPKHATLPIVNDPMGGKQSSALRELLALSQNAPQREEPGGWRKLAGFLSGLGTSAPVGTHGGQPFGIRFDPAAQMSAQEATTYAPYYRELEDYNEKFGRLSKIAGLENESLESGLRLRELERREDKDATLAQQFETREQRYRDQLEQTRALNSARIAQMQRPDSELVTLGEDRRLALINKSTGEIIKDYGSSGELSREDLENIRHLNRLEEIRASGEEARKTKATPGTSSTTDEMSVYERAEDRYRRAEELLNRNPEWEEYIQLGSNKNITIKPVDQGAWARFRGNVDEKLRQRQAIIDELYGAQSPEARKVRAENAEIKDASSSSSSSSGSTTITPVEGDTDTHVIVINSAGQRGRIPRANLEAALASGQYRRP